MKPRHLVCLTISMLFLSATAFAQGHSFHSGIQSNWRSYGRHSVNSPAIGRQGFRGGTIFRQRPFRTMHPVRRSQFGFAEYNNHSRRRLGGYGFSPYLYGGYGYPYYSPLFGSPYGCGANTLSPYNCTPFYSPYSAPADQYSFYSSPDDGPKPDTFSQNPGPEPITAGDFAPRITVSFDGATQNKSTASSPLVVTSGRHTLLIAPEKSH